MPSDNKFRLIELQFAEHKPLKDLKVEFVHNDTSNSPYTTVFIGVNGTGKSYLLRAIIDTFRELETLQKSGRRKNLIRGGFQIKYRLGDDLYEVDTRKPSDLRKLFFPGIIIQINGQQKPHSDIKLPQSLVANSVMLNDRFPVLKEGASDIYQYQGIKRTPSSGGTKSHVKRTVFGILNNLRSEGFIERIKQILGFIEYEETCIVSFYPKYKDTFFIEDVSPDSFKHHFSNLEDLQIRETKGWTVHPYNKIKDNLLLINNLVTLLLKIRSRFSLLRDGRKEDYFYFDIFNNDYTNDELKNIEYLYTLDILSEPSLELVKKQSNNQNESKPEFNVENSSSGEYHLLASLIAIATKIRPQSLVLIDEPEISLHPNWQMRYLDFLKKMFQNNGDSHFLIATHSHFIISDLEKESSSLIHMYNDGKITADWVNWNTYGWSAEDVLYKVFNVKTTSNFYLEVDLRIALTLIRNQSRDVEALDEIIGRLKKLNLSDADPTNDIINQIITYRISL